MSTTVLRLTLSITCAWALVFAPTLAPLSAHDIWIDRALLVHFGDPGERLDPIVPANLADLKAFAADGTETPATVLNIGEVGAVILPEKTEPAAVVITWDAGYRIKQGEKWVKASADDAKLAAAFRHSYFHSKTIFAWHARFADPVGLDLELVPLADPLAVRPGGTLALRVLTKGQAVAGAVIALEGEPARTLTSDAQGRIDVPIAATGLHILRAKLSKPDGANGELIRLAVLAFRIK